MTVNASHLPPHERVLSAKERVRILKIHALLASSFTGEVQAATDALERVAAGYGCTPGELVAQAEALADAQTPPAPAGSTGWDWAGWETARREAAAAAQRQRQREAAAAAERRRRERHNLPEDWQDRLERAIGEEVFWPELTPHEVGFAAAILTGQARAARPDTITFNARQAGAIEQVLRKAGLWPA